MIYQSDFPKSQIYLFRPSIIIKRMSTNQLPLTYIVNNKYYSYLRNHINSTHVSQEVLKQVIGEDCLILRSEPRQSLLQFSYCPIIIVVYGSIDVDEKQFLKGQFYQSKQQIVKINYKKSTTLLILCSDIINQKINNMNEMMEKTTILNRFLPTIKMKIPKKQLRNLAGKMSIMDVRHRYTKVSFEKGIYIFISGIFQLLYEGTLIMELQHDFYDFQDDQCTLRIKNLQGTYGFISFQDLSEILSEESALYFQKIKKQRQLWKDHAKLYPKYNQKQMKKKIKSNKTIKVNLSGTQTNKRTLTKCYSVQVYKNALKEGSPLKKSLSLSVSDSYRSYKQRQKLRKKNNPEEIHSYHQTLQKVYDRSFYDNKNKLEKLRKYEELKNKKYYGNDQWLELDDLKKGVTMGYIQIKKQYTKQFQQSMVNFKRIFNTAYDSPLKKSSNTFR